MDISGSDSDNEDWETEEEAEDEEQVVQSLFCDRKFKAIDEAIQYDFQNFNFNLRNYRNQARSSFLISKRCHLAAF